MSTAKRQIALPQGTLGRAVTFFRTGFSRTSEEREDAYPLYFVVKWTGDISALYLVAASLP